MEGQPATLGQANARVRSGLGTRSGHGQSSSRHGVDNRRELEATSAICGELLQPECCLLGERAHGAVAVEHDDAGCAVRAHRGRLLVQQGVSEPVADVLADPRYERDLLIAEVGLAFAAYERDAAPARVAGAEYSP